MPKLDDLAMHRDHSEAKFEHRLWLEDIKHWRTEHREAAAMLAAAQAAFHKLEAAIDGHAEAIRAHERHLERHEGAIHEHEWDSSVCEDPKLAAEHQDLEAVHAEARHAHDRLAELHECVMAEIRELLKLTLSGAVVSEPTSWLETEEV